LRTALGTIVVVALLGAGALYVHFNPPERMELEAGTLGAFPSELGGWRSVDLSFSDVVYEELEATDTLARRYTNDVGDWIWFVIIFHQNDRYGAHEPLVCYRSQGWMDVDSGLVPLWREDGSFDANWVLVDREGVRRLAVYWWYAAGDLATADRDKFMSRMAASGIVSNVTYGAFVRTSTVVEDGDFDGAMEVLKDFSEAALVRLPQLFVFTGES